MPFCWCKIRHSKDLVYRENTKRKNEKNNP
jgi:hypothetical protein